MSSTRCEAHKATTPAGYPPQPVPDVYIFPKSMMQVSFPVVDYSPEGRASGSAWPRCYMAFTSGCAKPEDIVATLAPPGSGLTVMARLTDLATSALNGFRDASDILRNSLQLEVCEEYVAKHTSAHRGEANGRGRYGYGCSGWNPVV